MIRPGENVLLDTTAIIEAHRQGIWEPIVNGFRLATVEKCIEEVDTGNLVAGERLEIDTGRLRMEMTVRYPSIPVGPSRPRADPKKPGTESSDESGENWAYLIIGVECRFLTGTLTSRGFELE